VLVVTSYLSMVAAVAIGPILPKLAQHFQSDPQVGVLTSFVATLPALFVALLSAPFGFLADRIGRRRLLIAAVSVYGVCGIAPLWLHSLRSIVLSRAAVGITEAAIMTCGTALLGDYFHGDARERWFACQTGSSTFAAIAVVIVAGVLGENNWRAPFMMYALAFVLLPFVVFTLWEPAQLQAAIRTHGEHTKEAAKLPWRELSLICLVTLFASTAFYVVVVQLGFILTERGVVSTAKIGMGASMAALGVPLGAVLFRLLRLPVAGKLAVSFTLSCVGFFVVAFSHGFAMTVIGAAVNGIGSGLVLPTLITWALSRLTLEVRGRGTGVWNTAMFLGQFLSPLIILWLKSVTGSLGGAVLVYAIACLAAAGIAAFQFFADMRQPAEMQA
jgi:MFS family permease